MIGEFIIKHGEYVVNLISKPDNMIMFYEIDHLWKLKPGTSAICYDIVVRLHPAILKDVETDNLSEDFAWELIRIEKERQHELLRYTKELTIDEFRLLIQRLTKTPLTKESAEKLGYIVDHFCYPWVAYIGSRFEPTLWRYCLTDLEAANIKHIPVEYKRWTLR